MRKPSKKMKSASFHMQENADMYLSLLGNSSLWSIIANEALAIYKGENQNAYDYYFMSC